MKRDFTEEYRRVFIKPDSALLSHVPHGVAHYVLDGSSWGVAVFEPGTTNRLATVAGSLDKSVAAWIAATINYERKVDPQHGE